MRFDLVIFDCDGVLVDSERIANAVESRLLTSLGVPLSEAEARERFKGKTIAEVATVLEGAAGGALPPGWQYEWGMATARAFQAQLHAVPGVRDVAAQLDALGVKTCVASQSPLPRVELSLAIAGFDGFFGDRIYTAGMVARPKPWPDLFLHAAERSGVAPSRCAVIEDSPSGVHAARAAGMAVFGYAADEDPEALAAAGATTFFEMKDLPALLGCG